MGRGRVARRSLLVSAVALSVIYAVEIGLFLARFGISEPFFLSLLLTTLALYTIALVQGFMFRQDQASTVPVLLAAGFGSVVLLLALGL